MRSTAPEATTWPGVAIRPGVTFPDWGAVASPVALAALNDILTQLRAATCWRDYTAEEDRVRAHLIRALARTGKVPALPTLAAAAGVTEADLAGLIDSLRRRDLVVVDGQGVVGAYPLTARRTEHEVRLDGRAIHAMCAIDALGAGAMLGQDVTIRSRCRHCGGPVAIRTGTQGARLAEAAPSHAVVWSGVRLDDGCAADTLCTVIAFFCGDAHLQAWRRENEPDRMGHRLSLDEALQVGRAVFGPTLRGIGEAAR